MQFGAVALVLIAGAALAFQSPTNTELSKVIGNAQATLVSFAGGSVVLALLVILFGTGDLSLFPSTPVWQWLGGLYGVFVVIMVTYAVPSLGVALTLTAIMFGNIAMGIVIDTLGLFATSPIPLDKLRVIGCLFMAAAIALVYVSRLKAQEQVVSNEASEPQGGKRTSGRSLLLLMLTLLAGAGGAAQAPTNAGLALTVGTLEASLVSFLGGTLIILIFTLVVSRGKLASMRGSEPWTWTGGLYGACGVFVIALTTPLIGVGIVVSTFALGQLIGGYVIDALGLMRCPKVKLDRQRLVGILLLAIGVAIITCARVL